MYNCKRSYVCVIQEIEQNSALGRNEYEKKSIFGTHKIASIDETYALASDIAGELEGGEVILLEGDLGAGKPLLQKVLQRLWA